MKISLVNSYLHKNADKKLILSIFECELNILKGNLHIKESD